MYKWGGPGPANLEKQLPSNFCHQWRGFRITPKKAPCGCGPPLPSHPALVEFTHPQLTPRWQHTLTVMLWGLHHIQICFLAVKSVPLAISLVWTELPPALWPPPFQSPSSCQARVGLGEAPASSFVPPSCHLDYPLYFHSYSNQVRATSSSISVSLLSSDPDLLPSCSWVSCRDLKLSLP